MRAKWLEDILVSFPAEKPKGSRGKGGISSTPSSYATTGQRCPLISCRPPKAMLRPTSPTTLAPQALRLLRPSLTSPPPSPCTSAGAPWSGRDPGGSSGCTAPSTTGPPSFSILWLGTFSPAAQPRELQGLTKPGCFLWLFS